MIPLFQGGEMGSNPIRAAGDWRAGVWRAGVWRAVARKRLAPLAQPKVVAVQPKVVAVQPKVVAVQPKVVVASSSP